MLSLFVCFLMNMLYNNVTGLNIKDLASLSLFSKRHFVFIYVLFVCFSFFFVRCHFWAAFTGACLRQMNQIKLVTWDGYKESHTSSSL